MRPFHMDFKHMFHIFVRNFRMPNAMASTLKTIRAKEIVAFWKFHHEIIPSGAIEMQNMQDDLFMRLDRLFAWPILQHICTFSLNNFNQNWIDCNFWLEIRALEVFGIHSISFNALHILKPLFAVSFVRILHWNLQYNRNHTFFKLRHRFAADFD